jgi:hypothetical protein
MAFTPQAMTTADLMVLATQLALAHILEEIGKHDEKLLAAIKRGFDNAALDAERMAMRGPAEKRAQDAASLLEIIEGLRSMTFPRKDEPKHGV